MELTAHAEMRKGQNALPTRTTPLYRTKGTLRDGSDGDTDRFIGASVLSVIQCSSSSTRWDSPCPRSVLPLPLCRNAEGAERPPDPNDSSLPYQRNTKRR